MVRHLVALTRLLTVFNGLKAIGPGDDMIFEGSRYSTSKVTPVPDAKGVYHATIYPRSPLASLRYQAYRVVFGDRMDTIAAVALGDAELWWQVAQLNPELLYPNDLVPGSIIRIPTAIGV